MKAATLSISLLLVISACTGDKSLDDDGGEACLLGESTQSYTFEESGGQVVMEAEHYSSSTNPDLPRAWCLTSANTSPGITPDPDPAHLDDASGGAYLEGLPDTRVTDDDDINNGESFFANGGEGPILTYRVMFATSGRYYMHARAYSTGTEDNGIHIGIDGTWPDSGHRLQWCSGKNQWTWSSAKRDSGGEVCGIEHTIYIDVDTAGEHLVHVSMREDGFEADKFILTIDDSYEPDGMGPAETIAD